MPHNTPSNPSYERISIHEVIKNYKLMSKLKSLDTSEVIDILTVKGKKWYIEIAFKDNTKLLIANELPQHFSSQYKPTVKRSNDLFFGFINP